MLPTCIFRRIVLALAAAAVLSLSGCTSFQDYIHNGFKVGPNYCPPPAPVAHHWIDEVDIQATPGQDISCWWALFHDPTLDRLVVCAYRQNLTLREAAFRILQARATLGIAKGEIFPQTQNATGGYNRIANSQNTAQRASRRSFPRPVELRIQLGVGDRLLGTVASRHRLGGRPA